MTEVPRGKTSLEEVENLLKRGSHRLTLQNSNGRLVSVVGWDLLFPPFIVTEHWYGHEIYSALYSSLEEARREEGFDFSLFVLTENDKKPEGEGRGTI